MKPFLSLIIIGELALLDANWTRIERAFCATDMRPPHHRLYRNQLFSFQTATPDPSKIEDDDLHRSKSR